MSQTPYQFRSLVSRCKNRDKNNKNSSCSSFYFRAATSYTTVVFFVAVVCDLRVTLNIVEHPVCYQASNSKVHSVDDF